MSETRRKAIADRRKGNRRASVPDQAPVIPPPVVDPPPVTPPVTGSNEPLGCVKLAENHCSSKQLSGWYLQEGYTGAITVASDPTAPRSPNGVLVQNYTSKLQGGSSPGSVGIDLPSPRRQLYLAYWMKLSEGYVAHPSNVNKTFHTYNVRGNNVIPMVRGAGSGPLIAALNLQGIALPYEWYSGGTRVYATEANLDPTTGAGSVQRGRWHKYEYVFTGNTPGQRDGIASWYLDGALCATYTGIGFVASGQDNRWTGVNWSPTHGGGAVTITTPFTATMDHIYVSGQ